MMTSDGWTMELLQAGEDGRLRPLFGTVSVPLFQLPEMQVLVMVGEADRWNMREAFLWDEQILPIPIGYLAATEGRWVLRDLVLAELVGRYNSRPEGAFSSKPKRCGGYVESYCPRKMPHPSGCVRTRWGYSRRR